MKKKELKFKIYQHECVDCGWKIWRDYVIEDPVCSKCESTKPPKVTEDELVREIIINDTFNPQDYERAKQVAQDLIDGKPLEEIDGIELYESVSDESLGVSGMAKSSRMIGGSMLGFLGGGTELVRLSCIMPCFIRGVASFSTGSGRDIENNYY